MGNQEFYYHSTQVYDLRHWLNEEFFDELPAQMRELVSTINVINDNNLDSD